MNEQSQNHPMGIPTTTRNQRLIQQQQISGWHAMSAAKGVETNVAASTTPFPSVRACHPNDRVGRLLRRGMLWSAAWLLIATFTAPAAAQNSSLFSGDRSAPTAAAPVAGQGVTLQNASLYYRELPQPRQLKKHDLISIRVDESAQALAEGEVERRKVASFDALLSDWLVFDSLFDINPAPQTKGDQRVQGSTNQIYRAEGDVGSVESLQFKITAEIVDIRPNGTLVLEAHKVVQNNNEIWEYRLTGVCRTEDVDPNTNVILSEDLAELNIFKRERGHVRDSYKRGWLLRGWDALRAF
jgi:flagellar L-ring protein precursor FlgH